MSDTKQKKNSWCAYYSYCVVYTYCMLILCVVNKIILCAENGTSDLKKKSLFHARFEPRTFGEELTHLRNCSTRICLLLIKAPYLHIETKRQQVVFNSLRADISQNLIHYIAFLLFQVTKQPIRKLELHHSKKKSGYASLRVCCTILCTSTWA